MRIKIFTGTYAEIEHDLNSFFSQIKNVGIIGIDWKSDINPTEHVLVISYIFKEEN